jgi:hypothetical protein
MLLVKRIGIASQINNDNEQWKEKIKAQIIRIPLKEDY